MQIGKVTKTLSPEHEEDMFNMASSPIGPPKTGDRKKKESIVCSPMKQTIIPLNTLTNWNVKSTGVEGSEGTVPSHRRQRTASLQDDDYHQPELDINAKV